jgi:hypothetical protein
MPPEAVAAPTEDETSRASVKASVPAETSTKLDRAAAMAASMSSAGEEDGNIRNVKQPMINLHFLLLLVK